MKQLGSLNTPCRGVVQVYAKLSIGLHKRSVGLKVPRWGMTGCSLLTFRFEELLRVLTRQKMGISDTAGLFLSRWSFVTNIEKCRNGTNYLFSLVQIEVIFIFLIGKLP